MNAFQPKSLTWALILGSLIGYVLIANNGNLASFGANGELWKGPLGEALVSSAIWQFLHANFLHFLGNAFFLWYFGSSVEKLMGDARYAGLFFFETVVSTAALAFLAAWPTIGMSGFTMAILAYAAARMKEMGHPDAKGAFFFLFLNVALGAFGNVSLVAHLAGAVSGLAYRFGERLLKKA